ncbi:PAS domain S-box protein, partial [archaeon]|nr:PAS domain S-box protein [archaeon]
MKLKGKILIILISVVLIGTAAYYSAFRFVILQSFIELDRHAAEENMERCNAALNREIKLLNRFVHDWSAWDDTYNFTHDKNGEFIKENLTWEVFRDQKLNIIHIYDTRGRLIWGKTYDLPSGKEFVLDLSQQLKPGVFTQLIRQKNEKQSRYGIILTSHGPMMVSSNPILTSAVKGPVRGVLLMGRFVDKEIINQISEQVDVKLAGLDPRKYPDITTPPPGKVILRESGPESILAYSRIDDIGGDPALIFKSTMQRDIMIKGKKAYTYGLILILGGGLVLILASGGLIQLLVLEPVSALTNSILDAKSGPIRLEKSLASRKDELGTLFREFDAMMKNLNERENALWLKEKGLRQIIDLVPHFIFAKDETGRYILANKSLSDAYDIPVAELIGKYDADFVKSGNEVIRFRANDEDVLRSGEQKVIPEEILTDAQGNARILQTTKIPFTFSGTTTPAVLGISVDITEIKKAQTALLESERRMSDIIDFLPDATFAIDREGIVIAWNNAMEELTGIRKEDILGRGDYAYA